MSPATPPALDSRESWRVLAGAGVVFVFSVPALFGSTFGLFMVPFEQSQGWGRADIAFSLMLTTAISWLSVLAGGWLADHLRLKPLLLVGIVLGAANLAAFSLMGASVWHFYALVVALAFTTMGASPLILSKLVQGWFDKRLGSALGILFACASVGAVLHPLIVTAVIQGAGWRQAFVAMAAMHLVFSLLAVALLVHERAPGVAAAPAALAAPQDKTPMVAFLRSRTWWMLALWNLLFACGAGAIMVHFAALLHDRGVAPTQIGLASSLIGASLFAGNLLAGWLADRVHPQRMAWTLMLAPLTSALLMLQGRSFAALGLAALVLGLASGSDGSLSAFLARYYFGAKRYGQAAGTQMVATAIGGGLAPWLSGLMRDRSGDYQLSLTFAAAAFGGAVVAGWLLPTQGHEPELDMATPQVQSA
jgi:sugar phosphate permease